MKKLVFCCLGLCVILLVVGAVSAQMPAPKPGPEHEKLAYFVGKWTSEGDLKPGAFGPGGKYIGTETCEWLSGKFAVACKTDGTLMGAEIHALSVMSYDTNEKAYVYFESNSYGEINYSHGSVDGDTWTWTSESKMNGQPFRGRFVLKQTSPDVATYSFEMGMGSEPLAKVMDGKQTRQK